MFRLLAAILLPCCACQPFVPYTCAKSLPEAMQHFHGEHPFHMAYSEGGYTIASQLAVWVREVLGEDEESMPLKYAYYANVEDSKRDCLVADSAPYVEGGGQLVCDMLQWNSGFLSKQLGSYLTRILDLGCAARGTGCVFVAPTEDWNNAKELVTALGYTPYATFVKDWKERCPKGLYNPSGECKTIEEYVRRNKAGEKPYYGMSGGGGSGAGFEVFCVGSDGNATTLVSGGGGGGSGMTSPEECSPVESGGGGGGGAEVGDGTLVIGAGAGNDPVGVKTSHMTFPTVFAADMKLVASEMKKCKAAGKSVVLRGGGGGGAGFEAFTQYDMTNCSADQPEVKPNALSVGYGFQFAMGRNAKLTPDASLVEEAYVSCPVGDGACRNCVDERLRAGNATEEAISKIFKCAQKLSSSVCKRARTKEGKPYGEYGHYSQCNCPVARLYKRAYLPDLPQWKYDRHGRCVYLEPTPAPGDWFPEVTERDLMEHPEWCRNEYGCHALPGCEHLESML